MKTPIFLSIAIALMIGCSGAESDPNPDLTAACRDLCEAQAPCDNTQLTLDECTSACVADVGVPGPECTAAMNAWADCVAMDCSETACEAEVNARYDICGGTG